MFPIFSLTLMVNHACNLRCTYCYTGAKFRRRMSDEVATVAIRRAISGLEPNGTLELGFFGGEPLLEADSIQSWITFARETSEPKNARLTLTLTTNGTVGDSSAWQVMLSPELQLSISHDGLPAVHDRHRRAVEGRGSSDLVLATMNRLHEANRDFNVVMVVRPDNVDSLADGIEFLQSRGVRQFTPSLDLWTPWTRADAARLRHSIARCADLWSQSWPELAISWFDEKAAQMLTIPLSQTARCQFGHGQIAVSPVGNFYPCERLIGEDRDDNPMRLPGHVLDGDSFRRTRPAPTRSAAACSQCVLESMCGTSCRCSNFVRTGDPTRPDGLLCLLDATCFQEVARVLSSLPAEPQVFGMNSLISSQEPCHV